MNEPIDTDSLLESVVAKIIAAGDALTETRETLLSQVSGCIADCRGTLSDCAEECRRQIEDRIAGIKSVRDDALSEAELLTRGNVASLEDELRSLGGESEILAGGNGGDTPPGGGGGGEYCGDVCRDRLNKPQCPPWDLFLEWDDTLCQWVAQPIDFLRFRPSLFFGNPGVYEYIGELGQRLVARVPPDGWARGIRSLVPVTVRCRTIRPDIDCQYTFSFTGSTPGRPTVGTITPGGSIFIPPGGQPPPPPPTPPIEPPTGQPPSEPPPTTPPPGGEECEGADPCYPHIPRVVQQYTRRVPPLPVTYYIRLRCLDICTAEVECWEAWCPPDDGSGWVIVGPYQFCPSDVEIDRSIRYYCRIGGREPPGGTPIGGPPPPEPPVNPPPPPEPPPREEQCKVQQLHPPRWDAITPLCMDEAKYLMPLYGGIDTYDNVSAHFADVIADLESPSEEPAVP